MTLKEAWEKRKEFRAEGSKLYAEGDLLWANTVIATYGNKCVIK